MFGDIENNVFNFEKGTLGDTISLLTDFSANGSYEKLDSNVKMVDIPDYAIMVRTTDLENADIFNDAKYITKEAYKLLSKSKLYGTEIIINKIGSAGKVYLMPKLNMPASLGRNAFMLRFKENINRIFIYYYLTSANGQLEIKKRVKGAVTKTITKDAVREVPCLIPPIELQNEFATFVELIDKLKFSFLVTSKIVIV